MPRDIGTGLYHYPAGTEGITAQTIFSARYNTFINDLANTLNQALPINMGGTGADNAMEARDNLDVEVRGVQVTNYDSHVFESGSFWSDSGATGEPVDGHGFVGSAIVYDANFAVIEARDLSDTAVPGIKYVRERLSGTWGAWKREGESSFVLKAGDSMTGTLTIKGTAPHAGLLLQKPDGSTGLNIIAGYTVNSLRWDMYLGNGGEVGGNIGSDFQLNRYNDVGAPLADNPVFSIKRETGNATFNKGLVVSGGIVTINGIPPQVLVALNKSSSGAISGISGQTAGVNRWLLQVGDGTAEGGSNTGSDFSIVKFSDGGTLDPAPPLSIKRSTGITWVTGLRAIAAGTPSSSQASTVQIGYSFIGCAWRPSADNGFPCAFQNMNDTLVGSIQTTASATVYATSSDARLKEDLKSFDAGNIIDDTNVYDFKWKSTDERAYGILAQQAVEVYPTAVSYMKEQDAWGIDYSKYVPVILQELKALRARVAELEGKLEVGVKPP